MFLTVKRLMALSLPTHREQFEQRTNLTWPRPFLLRPLFLRFLVYETGPSISKRVQLGGASATESCHPSSSTPLYGSILQQNHTAGIPEASGKLLTILDSAGGS